MPTSRTISSSVSSSGVRQPVQALGRHAVGAAQVAPVGQRHAQVGVHPAEAVLESLGGHGPQSRPAPAGSRVAHPAPDSLGRCGRCGSCSVAGGCSSRSPSAWSPGAPGGSASGSSTGSRTARRATPWWSGQRGPAARPGGRRAGPRPRRPRVRAVAGGHRDRHLRDRRHRDRALPHPRRRLRRRRRGPARDRRRHLPAGRPRLGRHGQPRGRRLRRPRAAVRRGHGHRLGPRRRQWRQHRRQWRLDARDLQREDRRRPRPRGVRRLRRPAFREPGARHSAGRRPAAGARQRPALLLRPAVVVLRRARHLRLLLPHVRRVARGQARQAPLPRAGRGRRRRRKADQRARKQVVRAAYDRELARAQSERSMPPSTGTIAPDTNDEAGDSRKAATRPNSSGSP